MTRLLDRLQEQSRQTWEQYGAQRPLRGYLSALGVYGGSCLALLGTGLLAGRRLPERIGLGDLALITVATHKLSRLLAKDAVTSPLRAPFTSYSESQGESEVAERSRGGEHGRAVGELVSCPFCLDQWVATGFVAGTVLAPRQTRLVASVFATVAGADWLHVGYAAARTALHG